MKRETIIMRGNRSGKALLQSHIDKIATGNAADLITIIYEQTLFPWQRAVLEALANGDRVTVY